MTKNPNGAGSKIKKMPGRDLYRARYTDATGKQKSVYGKTVKECREKLTEALSNADKGLVFASGNISVGEYMDRWIEDSAKGDLAPRTYHNYKLQIRQHIKPGIGRVKLSQLSPANVQALYAAKLRDGMASSSVRYIHAVLHRALEQAVRFGMIPRNPAAVVDAPKVRQDEIQPLDADQTRRLLDAARGDRFEALYVLSLTTGLRCGESLGLRWSDIDFDKKTVRISRQLQRMRRDGDESGTLVFTEPKHGSRRTLDLPQRAVDALRSHRKRQAEEQLRTGAKWRDNGLVFATGKGTPLDAQNIVNRYFKPLLKRAGLPLINWHAMRHTYATLLLAKGVHIGYVQKALGHKNIQLTMRYSHWMPSMGKHIADGIDEALG